MLKFKKMGTEKIPILLITANVGSIFEDPTVMLPIWTSEFLQAVSRMDPKFIALHLQEVGGKTYEKSMQYVQDFVQRLVDCPELRLFDKIRIYLDEDFSSPERFTALGNLYFAHSSLSDVKMWDFDLKTYVEVHGKEVHSGNIEMITTKEKAKFPKHFFPECKWSRKGFIRTRWCVRGTCIELVNIHLFHDASNLIAAQGYPSVYTRSRRRALRHTLRHIHSDVNAAPYFIFGDFNFRPDTQGVIKKLTEDLTAYRCGDGGRVVYHRGDQTEETVLSVGKKEFTHLHHQTVFREPWFQKFDRELEALRPHLYEFPVKFPPTYPFEENVELPTSYMNTRCPAWCDRVVLSQTARLLLHHDTRTAENKHLHTSRKSVADGDSSGRGSSTDSSPNRSVSPAQQSSPSKPLEKKSSVLDLDALSVPGINVARKSIADPTSVQQAISARVSEGASASPRRRLVRNQSEGGESEVRRYRRPDYGHIGELTPMGDHKPVYLRVSLHSDRGTVRCCIPPLPCICCALATRYPSKISTTPPLIRYTEPHLANQPTRPNLMQLQRTGSLNEKMFRIPEVEITKAEYSSFDCIFVNDIDTRLLSARPLIDPYTPESVDSRTPDFVKNDSDLILKRDKSVSPTQLKSRLAKLLNEKTVPELERLNSRESCKSSNAKKSGLCCLALKCYGFCRKNAKKVTCTSCKNGLSDCCE